MSVREDRGAAMMIAVGVLMLVALLGAVALANARNDVRRAERLVDRAESGSLVDIAVAAAWGDIVAGAAAPFSRSGTAASGPWSVAATPIDAHRWTIDAEGGTGVDAAAAVVVVSRELRHPYTFFTGDLTAGPLRGRVTGRVGITGAAVFGGRSMGTLQELIGPDAACSGCRRPVVVDEPADRAVAAGPPSPLPCPAIGGVLTGMVGAGSYACTDPGPLTLDGTITVDGPVVIELGPDVSLDLAAAEVNPGRASAEFLILQPDAGSGAITADGADLNGVLLAPTTPMTTSDLTWRGSIDVASFVPSAGARLDGAWDATLEDLGVGEWHIESWDVQPG